MKRPGVLSLVSLALLAFSINSHGHRVHFGWTSIQQGNDSIEIVHRFHEHDANLWLTANESETVDIAELRYQAKFAVYAAKHFYIANEASVLEPEIVGAELKGRYLFVYQELASSTPISKLIIDSDILMDLHDEQIHLVDVRMNSHHKTLEFTSTTKPQSVLLTKPDHVQAED